jgi:hypothetical protein
MSDLMDKKFGRLLVISKTSKRIHGSIVWQCMCNCGNITHTTTDHLTLGRTKSCGCLNKEGARKLGLAKRKYDPFISNAHNIHQSSYGDMDFDKFLELSQQNCYYCGRAPHNKFSNKSNRDNVFVYSGIDRLDSSKGHEPGNVVPCCWDCNSAKMLKSENEFLTLISMIYHNRCSK